MTKSNKIIDRIRADFPDFRIENKQDSFFWKLLGKLNKRWLSDFSTTIGKKVWLSTKFQNLSELEKCAILVHEAIHLYDIKRDGKFYFYLKYLSPQAFSSISILGIWEPLFLFSLVFLLPQYSIGRTEYEFRAYIAGFFVYHFEGFFKRNPSLKSKIVDWIDKQFSGSSYYWMFPSVKQYLDSAIYEYEERNQFVSFLYENGELFSPDQLCFIKDVKKIMEEKYV